MNEKRKEQAIIYRQINCLFSLFAMYQKTKAIAAHNAIFHVTSHAI